MSRFQSPVSEVMNITSMVDPKHAEAAAAAASAAAHAHAQAPTPEHSILSHHQLVGAGISRTNSPHGSDVSYHSAPRSAEPLGSSMNLANRQSYPSPTAMQTPMSMNGDTVPQSMMMPGMSPLGAPMMAYNRGPHHSQPSPQATSQPEAPPVKSFACRDCGKGFARRSDLARHERIHSGHRPHVCDHEGCGKQFIQRSALTVHQRVHTGEKPHMCERCGKPFSDSSSLARHRRIHSGKRPYKCPYADCQKTFTRRTTLTRHQNHHTGTVEESEVNTARVLESLQTTKPPTRSLGSDGGHDGASNRASPMNTPSPGGRPMSMSPHADMMRQSEYSYMSNGHMSNGHMNNGHMGSNGPLPLHLRTDIPAQSPTSAPAYSTTSAPYSAGMRPTSHPTSGFAPPQTMEPSLESHGSQPGSAAASPHMGSVGWQSPSHMPSPTTQHMGSPTHHMASPTQHMASPSHHHAGPYVYPDPDQHFANAGLGGMYYPNQMRRHGSHEPLPTSYDIKPRNELWAGQ